MQALSNMTNGSEATGTNGTSGIIHGLNSTLNKSLIGMDIKIGLTVAYAVIFTVALFGNSFGLFVVLKKSSTSKVINLFIANMAVADLLLTFTVMPYQVNFIYHGTIWFGGTIGNISCKALFYVMPVSIAAAVLTMLIISINRFYAVCYPLRGTLFQKPRIASAIIWVLSLLLMIPYVFYSGSKVEFNIRKKKFVCLQLSSGASADIARVFHICIFIILYAFPLLTMAILYVLICHKLWLRKIPGIVSTTNRAVLEMSKRKVVRLLVILVVVFALCWFPTYVNHYFWFLRAEHGYLPFGLQFFFLWLAHANSAINPCLYILLNDSFRKELVSMLACFLGCFSSQSNRQNVNNNAREYELKPFFR